MYKLKGDFIIIMMNTNNVDMFDFDAWNKHVNKEFDRIMAEYYKAKKEIEEKEDSIATDEIDNGKAMLDHMMLADQQNRMIDEDRRITEQNNFFMDQQNLMMINMLHHGF